ncbi:YdcF family protein [Lentisphaerota bacterium ZTH]|nr:YdcF family protein [Lentisphaerota bacterium]WET07307.1 YdcF family protein [Lentisphaerota bacterium ZTH]
MKKQFLLKKFITAFIFAREQEEKGAIYYLMDAMIIILGSPNDAQGNLSSIAMERCDEAIRQYFATDNCKIVLTGGFGEHFNITDKPHAFYAAEYLISKNVAKPDILEFVESSNTYEDAEFSAPVVEKYCPENVIIVTSDFHRNRAEFLFNRNLPDRKFSFACSSTCLPAGELQKLVEHERKALKKLKSATF